MRVASAFLHYHFSVCKGPAGRLYVLHNFRGVWASVFIYSFRISDGACLGGPQMVVLIVERSAETLSSNCVFQYHNVVELFWEVVWGFKECDFARKELRDYIQKTFCENSDLTPQFKCQTNLLSLSYEQFFVTDHWVLEFLA